MNTSRLAGALVFSVACGIPAITANAQVVRGPNLLVGSRTDGTPGSRSTVCKQDDETPPSEDLLTRILRLPGRIVGPDSADRRSRVKSRVRNRIADYRSRTWVAPGGSCWYTSYESGYRVAQREHKSLLVYFAAEGDTRDQFEANTLQNETVTERLGQYVNVRVPLCQPHFQARARQNGHSTLVSDPAFSYLEGRPGIVVVDLVGDKPELTGFVTFVRPFGNRPCSAFELATILALPRATLTQRTMIYAVRLHSEQPKSPDGELSPSLLDQAARHSQQMADIELQGHHNWDTRFYQISSALGPTLTAKEVVAESWGHEPLLDAALECVHSWRGSPGHWSAVRATHHFYGYDMKRGANGKWYATGQFGD